SLPRRPFSSRRRSKRGGGAGLSPRPGPRGAVERRGGRQKSRERRRRADCGAAALFLGGGPLLPRGAGPCRRGGGSPPTTTGGRGGHCFRGASLRQPACLDAVGRPSRLERGDGCLRRFGLVGAGRVLGRSIGPGWRRAACPQPGRPALLDGPRIAADRGEIAGYRGRLLRARGVVLAQEAWAGRFEFPRTAVAGIAGI